MDYFKLYHGLVKRWHRSSLSNRLKRNRFNFIIRRLAPHLFAPNQNEKLRILDVGCDTGKDFIRFACRYNHIELYGIDINPKIIDTKARFIRTDAQSIPFPDRYFDLVISIGTLEHIEPIEKLCRVIGEMNRVGKSVIVAVPSIATLLEPHTGQLLWQIRSRRGKRPFKQLNYFSDDAWLKFKGFSGAETLRRYYLWPLKQDLWIVKRSTG